MADKRVVFQKFYADQSRYHFPYPPVYREKDADYICFTGDRKVASQNWEMVCVDSLETADLEPYLEKYSMRYELGQNQIQMGPIWDEEGQLSKEANIISAPRLEELSEIVFDTANFEPTADERGNYNYRKNPVYHGGKYDGRALLLMIGVPVSNQIDTIERCLNGISPLLDGLDAELIVIDTGSTDGTLDVCRRYGARIVPHPWHDNMNLAESRSGTFHGLALVEHDFYIMLVEAVAFWSCLDLGREDSALEHLKKISLEIVGEKRAAILESGFAAGDAIFGELCARLTAVQWEAWSGEILDAFVAGMDRDDTCHRQLARIPVIFSHVSVPAVITWARRHENKNKGKPGRRLTAYALALDPSTASVQELCMASWILKEEYVRKRETPEGRTIFRQYMMTTGAFAAGFYHEKLLCENQSHAVPPEIRAASRIAAVLLDGAASSGNVALLKQALADFPPFHEEIRRILTEMKSDGG